MMEYEISTPNREYSGIVGDVVFTAGQARTASPRVVAYCRGAGYTVTPVGPVDGDPVETVEPVETPDQAETVEPGPLPAPGDGKPLWVAAAVRHGHPQDEAVKMTKEQLIKLLSTQDGDQT